LSLYIGTLVSLDRIRGIDDSWQTPAGLIEGFTAVFRFIGLDGIFYAGQGHTFLYGDPFYRLDQYARFDVYFMPFRTRMVNVKFDVGFHIASGQLDYSQQIMVSVTLP
jgi:hypothetical protein